MMHVRYVGVLVVWVGVGVMGAVQVYQTMGSGRCGEPYHALTTPTEVSCALHCGKSEMCTGFQTSEDTGQSGVTCELLHTLTSPDLSTNFICYAQVPSSTSTAIPTISGSLTTPTTTPNNSSDTTSPNNSSGTTTTALTYNSSGNSGVTPTPSSNSTSTLQSDPAATNTASNTSETTTTSAGVVTTTTTTPTSSSTPAGFYCSPLGLCGINRIDMTNSGTITGVESTTTNIMITALLIQTSAFSNNLETCSNGIIVGFQKSGSMQKALCAVLINTSVISVNQTASATVDTDKITCSSHYFMYNIQWNSGKSQRIAASCYPGDSQR